MLLWHGVSYIHASAMKPTTLSMTSSNVITTDWGLTRPDITNFSPDDDDVIPVYYYVYNTIYNT